MSPTGLHTADRDKLRGAVRFFYDLQSFRKASFNRSDPKGGAAPPNSLDHEDRKFLGTMGDGVTDLEKTALSEVERLVSKSAAFPWLDSQRGVGPTIAGFLVAEFDIHMAVRPSQFWAFAGLGVVDGKAPRSKKGVKNNYNAWLRSKCLFVLGGCLLKAKHKTYYKIYKDYRHRLDHRIEPCRVCIGTGKIEHIVEGKKPRKTKCYNCKGKKRGPWGYGDQHRHRAALRYMVKMFLLDFWKNWREAENLPVVPPYHEEKLGLVHKSDRKKGCTKNRALNQETPTR